MTCLWSSFYLTVQAGYLLSDIGLPKAYTINIILCFSSKMFLHITI